MAHTALLQQAQDYLTPHWHLIMCLARQCLQDSEAATAQQLLPDDDPYLQAKDQNECTPLHIAILQGE